MFQINLDKYIVWLGDPTFQPMPFSAKNALIKDTFNQYRVNSGFEEEVERCFIAVQQYDQQPFLTIDMWYWPGRNDGSLPGILYVPGTEVLFVGSGQRIVIYNLSQPSRLWASEGGTFTHWRRYGDYVLSEYEHNLVAWDLSGDYKWNASSYFSFQYYIENEIVHLIADDVKYSFSMKDGPEEEEYGWLSYN